MEALQLHYWRRRPFFSVRIKNIARSWGSVADIRHNFIAFLARALEIQKLLTKKYSAYYERTTYTGVVATRWPSNPPTRTSTSPWTLYLPGSRRLWNQVHGICKPWLDDTVKCFGMAMGYAENKNGEKAHTLEIPVSYTTKPEVNLGSPIAPMLEIWKQAVTDATASHMLISPNALPGQILAHIRSRMQAKFGDPHRRPKPNTISLGSSSLPSMKRSGRKDSGSSYISGFLVIPLSDMLS